MSRAHFSPTAGHKQRDEQVVTRAYLPDLFELHEIDEARTWCKRQERQQADLSGGRMTLERRRRAMVAAA